jgi:transcription initiation factor TFIIIB Brf1 subunit/transcription initiation factor TFIIB
MSTKVKKCKTCGTTNIVDFAPRKSVICKNCDKPPVLPVLEQSLVEVPMVNEEKSIEQEVAQSLEIEIKDEKGLKHLIDTLEESVKQIQEDIKKLNKLKKLFPRIFPEDN